MCSSDLVTWTRLLVICTTAMEAMVLATEPDSDMVDLDTVTAVGDGPASTTAGPSTDTDMATDMVAMVATADTVGVNTGRVCGNVVLIVGFLFRVLRLNTASLVRIYTNYL